MVTRRSFIARAAAFVAGVRLAIEGAVVDLATPEAHAEVKPAVETTGLRIDPDTLEFEFLSETGWVGTGHALHEWKPEGYEKMPDDPIERQTILNFQAAIGNGALTRSWKQAARPKML
jgi:hypothetical protein